MSPMLQRNRKILRLRKEGLSLKEVARRFELSPARIYLIEKQDKAERSMAERRARIREELRTSDDMERLWPVEELVDALGLTVITRKRLVEHFVTAGKSQISLRELMDLCVGPRVQGADFTMPPLFRIYGVGKKGFRSVVNGLTGTNLGERCNQEWQWRLAKVNRKNY